MADQLITSGVEATAIVPELWSGRFYDVLLADLPFNDSISMDYQSDIADLGDIVNISTVPEFSEATELAEGSRNDADAVTVTKQQLTINKRLVKDFIVTKRAQLQSLPMMDKLREHAVYSIMKKMQSIIIETIVPSASAPDHDISFDSGTTLALADIIEAKELLDQQDVPESDRKMICGVSQYNDLFDITGFTSNSFIPSGSPLTEGSIQTPVLGFNAMMTSELGDVAYLFHPQFLTMAIQDQLNIEVFNLGVDGVRASRVNVDLLFGLKQLDDTRVVKLS